MSKAVTRLSWTPVPLSDTRIAPVSSASIFPGALSPLITTFRGVWASTVDDPRVNVHPSTSHAQAFRIRSSRRCWPRVAGSYTSRSKPSLGPVHRVDPVDDALLRVVTNRCRIPDEIPTKSAPNGLAFGRFVLDLARGALLRDGTEVRLRAKSLDVLAYLVRHAGRLIAKQELIEAVWPDVAVTDDSLVQCLVEIRRALGDDQAWIHTARAAATDSMATSGRWWTARHCRRLPSAAPGRLPTVVAAPSRGRAWLLAVASSSMLAVAAAAWAFWGRAPASSPRTAEARLAYEEGERSVERRTRESLGQAIAAYERAIALDPTFAPGHAGLADTLVVQGVFGGARPDDSYPRAREAALRAVELDPTLAEGHVALGHVQVQWDRDWRGAERSYRRALALDPNAPRARMLYALFLGAMGRVDESLQESRIAASLRPESATVGAVRAIVLFGARRSEEAIEQGRRTIGLDPAFSLVHFWQALALRSSPIGSER